MSFFDALDDTISKLKKISENAPEMAVDILKENESVVLKLNTDDQLYKKGVRSDGVKLASIKPYANSTVRIKRSKGQPTNRVTTRDTGRFHSSFRAKDQGDKLEIDSEGVDYAKYLEKKYGKQIYDLTDQNKEVVENDIVQPEMERIIKTVIG